MVLVGAKLEAAAAIPVLEQGKRGRRVEMKAIRMRIDRRRFIVYKIRPRRWRLWEITIPGIGLSKEILIRFYIVKIWSIKSEFFLPESP